MLLNQSTKKLEVELYGGLRKFSDLKVLEVEVPVAAVAADVRRALIHRLGGEGCRDLIETCALAQGDEIMGETDLIDRSRVAFLPPVCGG